MATALLPDKMQSLLKEAGLSESELARRIDIPRATLNRLVAGKMASPKLHVLRAIADYFDISVDQLMWQEPISTPDQAMTTTLPLVPWQSVHQSQRFGQFPKQRWQGLTPDKECFLSYVDSRNLQDFPNHKQLLLIAPDAKPRPGQLVVLHLHKTNSNVIRQMFVEDRQFCFKHPNWQDHQHLPPGSYQFIGVVRQVLQLD